MRAFLTSSAMGLSILALAGSAKADILNASVNEQLSAFATAGTGNPADDVTKTASNTTLPPIELSIDAITTQTSAHSDVLITNYQGPATPLDSTPGLRLTGSLDVSTGLNGSPVADASIQYNFTLDAAQQYSFQGAGGTSLSDSTDSFPLGSIGVLQPGNYQLISSVHLDVHSSTGTQFSIVILPAATPEPTSLALLDIGVLPLLRRRRQSGVR